VKQNKETTPSRRSFTGTLAALVGAGVAGVRASDDGRVVVLSTTDRVAAQPLIDDFEALHRGITVDYRELGSMALNQQFLLDVARPQPEVDVLWSSAMDLQVKLVNDGFAQAHDSAYQDALPAWAVWKREAFGTTFEPVGLAWHRDRLAALGPSPTTHAELRALMARHAAALRGLVCTYDIERAGLGYLVAAQDAAATPTHWDLVRALGACRARGHDSSAAMLDSLVLGDAVLAYNVLGPYAEAYARQHPALRVGYLHDYTLVLSRVAFISRRSPRPAAARLWLEHLLSRRGQAALAMTSGLYAVREDVDPRRTATALRRQLGASARPIALAPGLMAHLDRSKRAEFLNHWHRELTVAR
jgi:iron(III) transport system substrate-binding protein